MMTRIFDRVDFIEQKVLPVIDVYCTNSNLFHS